MINLNIQAESVEDLYAQIERQLGVSIGKVREITYCVPMPSSKAGTECDTEEKLTIKLLGKTVTIDGVPYPVYPVTSKVDFIQLLKTDNPHLSLKHGVWFYNYLPATHPNRNQ